MEMNMYQVEASKTAIYPKPVILDDDGTMYKEVGFVYPALGLGQTSCLKIL